MKQLTKWLIAAVVSILLLSGCSGGGDEFTKVDYLPFKDNESDLYGAISAKGEILFANEFTNMTNVVDGVFAVEENEHYSLYKADKKPALLKENLLNIGVITSNSDYILAVNEDSPIFLMNKKGEMVKELKEIDGKEVKSAIGILLDNYLVVELSDKRNVILDKKGNPVCIGKEEWSEFSGIDGEKLLVKIGNEWQVVDFNGNTILSIDKKYSPNTFGDSFKLRNFKNGIFVVKCDDEVSFMNIKGEINKCPNRVKSITDFDKKWYIYVSRDGMFGVMTMDHEVIVRDKYDYIQKTDNGYIAGQDDKFEILDNSGNVVSGFTSKVYPCVDGFDAFVQMSGNRYSLINAKGEEVSKNSYAKLTNNPYVSLDNLELKSDYTNWKNAAQDAIDSIKYVAQNGLGKTLKSFDPYKIKKESAYKFSKGNGVVHNVSLNRKTEMKINTVYNKKLAKNVGDYWFTKYEWCNDASMRRIETSFSCKKDELYTNVKAIFDATMSLIDYSQLPDILQDPKGEKIECYKDPKTNIAYLLSYYPDEDEYEAAAVEENPTYSAPREFKISAAKIVDKPKQQEE